MLSTTKVQKLAQQLVEAQIARSLDIVQYLSDSEQLKDWRALLEAAEPQMKGLNKRHQRLEKKLGDLLTESNPAALDIHTMLAVDHLVENDACAKAGFYLGLSVGRALGGGR